MVMGSDSDWPLMETTAKTLARFGVSFETRVISAHRTPKLASSYAAGAKRRGISVIIAAAGGAAHLAGVLASHTTLPVIGVPVKGGALDGLDALLSTVQMPSGIPVATVALGSSGALNAAILAIQILSLNHPELAARLKIHKRHLKTKVEKGNRRIQSYTKGKTMLKSILAALLLMAPLALAEQGTAGDASPASLDEAFRNISEIGAIMKEHKVIYSGTNLAEKTLNAVLNAIDPWGGAILTKEQAERRLEEINGIFYGIGCKFEMRDQYPAIIEVFSNSPAAEAGLQTNELIVKISGSDTRGIDIGEASRMLRGGKGEKLELTLRAGPTNAEERVVALTRSTIQIPATGTAETWPQGIGYLKINGLYTNSGCVVAEQLNEWQNDTNCFGAILDMRGAGGADLESSVAIASLFSGQGKTLFTLRDGSGDVTATHRAKPAGGFEKPAMVLIDRDTAGASEILAGALSNHRGAMLIGTPSRGDNRIRDIIPLSGEQVLYIATQQVELDNGPDYHMQGVTPHIAVTQTEKPPSTNIPPAYTENDIFKEISEQERNDAALIRRISGDEVLQRATDILLGLKALNIKAH